MPTHCLIHASPNVPREKLKFGSFILRFPSSRFRRSLQLNSLLGCRAKVCLAPRVKRKKCLTSHYSERARAPVADL